MKQHKISKPNPSPASSNSSTRQEIDAYTKELTRLIEKNPAKASQVFKNWLDQPAKNSHKKRAA